MQRKRFFIQMRDVFAMRKHMGWLHYILHHIGDNFQFCKKFLKWIDRFFEGHTDRRTAAFDAQYGTETFRRQWVRVSAERSIEELGFGYGPVNQDFFREIMNSIPARLANFKFIDVGAGKGAAVMLASEYGFASYLALELDAGLAEQGQANVARYCQMTGRTFAPRWIVADFMQWDLPLEASLLFLNNPFPDALSLAALQRIEASVLEHPRPLLLVYRKTPKVVSDHLHRSKVFLPLRLAPYWRVYSAGNLPAASGATVPIEPVQKEAATC